MKPTKPHDSMRGFFGFYLYEAMEKDPNIVVVTFDLGMGLFDKIKEDFGERFYNVGASEAGGMDIAVGLALTGKTVIAYSITPFLLARAYETIRNYIDHEEIPIKLIGSGRDKDYSHDGFSHDCSDAKKILSNFDNIVEYWPDSKEDMVWLVPNMLGNGKPCFVSLKR
jgi:transketolase